MSNVSKGIKQQLQEQIAALGFMDNANWISSTLEDLKDILAVANDYYNLTRAAINKEKSKLITNTTITHDLIPIRFESTIIPIQPSFEAVRFLEVKVNV